MGNGDKADAPRAVPIVVLAACVLTTVLWLKYTLKHELISLDKLSTRSGMDILGLVSAPPLFGVTITPKHLFIWRAAVFIWAMVVILNGANRYGGQLMAFYTLWNYTALCLYFGIMALIAFDASQGIYNIQYETKKIALFRACQQNVSLLISCGVFDFEFSKLVRLFTWM